MFIKKCHLNGILLLPFFLFHIAIVNAQHKQINGFNKKQGTYTLEWQHRGVEDSSVCSISVQLFEITRLGCTRINGKIKINSKSYFAKDGSNIAGEDGFINKYDYFSIDVPPGIYTIEALPEKGKYFKVVSEKLLLHGNGSYHFKFFLIRKAKTIK